MVSDEILVKRSRQGDREAFALLIERYQDKIYNLTYRLVSNVDDSADLTQEVFYRAMLKIKEFRGDSSFSTWLYRIATNICYDELRKRKTRRFVPLDDSTPDGFSPKIADKTAGPAEKCLEKLMQQHIQKAISTLPPPQRTAVILRDIEGLSYEEIAQISQCALGTVKSRISRGRKALRDLLMSEQELFSPEHVYTK
ncbi:MAG: sigma-70 family RNA polymerase sigma factor [Firmicutes bacterium]|nr:sigma-70 family RNA polymerase sigma factor [Bacillota bacterium]